MALQIQACRLRYQIRKGLIMEYRIIITYGPDARLSSHSRAGVPLFVMNDNNEIKCAYGFQIVCSYSPKPNVTVEVPFKGNWGHCVHDTTDEAIEKAMGRIDKHMKKGGKHE